MQRGFRADIVVMQPDSYHDMSYLTRRYDGRVYSRLRGGDNGISVQR